MTTPHWTPADSTRLYSIDRWSRGLFSVNGRGHMCFSSGDADAAIDMKDLVDEIRMRGLALPVLVRFTDVVRQRLASLAEAFRGASEELRYQGAFRGVYPIKVNQHRHVVEDILRMGREHHYGLECGSKAELLIAVAMHDDPEALIVCNGFKDRDFVETALAARKLGQKIVLVVEKPSELPFILEIARRTGVEPIIGIRMKLATAGTGRWKSSAGDRSKFGLWSHEIVEAIRLLKRKRMLSSLQLLHFHLGSQISDIHCIRDGLREATALFTEISRLGAPIQYMDVGGGLAVDYDGSSSKNPSSANYGVDEYAYGVVQSLYEACEQAKLPHPTIVTETGRALAAYHSVLVVEVMSASEPFLGIDPPDVPRSAPRIVRRMAELLDDITPTNFREVFHDAVQIRREALMMFSLRGLSLVHRAHLERYYWLIVRRILEHVRALEYVPEELQDLERALASIYYCNFSLFQSLPDHWAIDQLFPIVPLHRLDEEPVRSGVLADVTCDSDGMIDAFVGRGETTQVLPLHAWEQAQPYYLGVFLVGAYQEVLGDLHNLFGDTNVVHVSSGPRGYVIERTVEGERIANVLGYVQYERREILARIRAQVERALAAGAMTLEDSAPFVRRVEQHLEDYTYLRQTDGSPQRARSPRRS